MHSKWTENFSYITGIVRNKQLAFLAIVSDELATDNTDHSYFLGWQNGDWQYYEDDPEKEWSIVSMTICEYPTPQVIAIGAWGEVLCVGGGDVHEEQIISGDDSPKTRGPLRFVRSIDGIAYAVGMGRQVYKRVDLNNWISIDQGARPEAGNKELVGFDAIDGFSATEIYAVGRNGEIWIFNGKIWRQIDSPTNMILTNLCCANDGNVYACGRNGTLLKGRGDEWEIIDHELLTDDLWGLAWFNDKLYISTRKIIFEMASKDDIIIVDMGKDKASTCYHLSAADGVMWSIGAKDVMAFDGKTWTRID
jgi:hypothetical protein